MRHRANDRQMVHLPGQVRNRVGEADARHAGGDGPHFAANLGDRIRLGIKGVVMRQPAVQPDEDGAARPRRMLGTLRAPQKAGQRQTQAAQGAGEQKSRRPTSLDGLLTNFRFMMLPRRAGSHGNGSF